MPLEEIGGQIRKAPHNNNYNYLDDKIANVFSSLTDDVTSKINYLYIINSDPIYITNIAQDVGKFTIDVVNTTHLLLGFMFVCNANVPTILSIEIKYDNSILATVKNSMSAGYHTVSAPYIIPAVSTGVHEIKIIVSCDSGQIEVDQNCMNLSLTAQYLNTKMPELPHAEKKEDISWIDIRALFFGDTNTTADIIINTPVPLGIIKNIAYTNIYNNELSTSVSYMLNQVADQILFNADDSSKFNTEATVVFDGTLHFKNNIANIMTSADLGANKVYTQSMADNNLYNTIESILITGDNATNYNKKYLIVDGTEVKNWSGSTYQKIGDVPLTEEMFNTYGMTSLVTSRIGLISNTPILAMWTDDTTGSIYTLRETVVPKPKLMLMNFNFNVPTGTKSFQITSNVSGNALIRLVCSIDSGAAWKSWYNNAWTDININDNSDIETKGMTSSVFNALTNTSIDLLGNTTQIRFGCYLKQSVTTETCNIDLIRVNFK